MRKTSEASVILRKHAGTLARALGVPLTFVWKDLNWGALVTNVDAALSPDGVCPSCGHPYAGDTDLTFVSTCDAPDRLMARYHAKHIVLMCQACRLAKGSHTFAEWLDVCEQARLRRQASDVPEPPYLM